MKKGAKRRGASKAGREDAVAERQNDEVVAESLEESQQPKEEAEAKEEENQENGEEDKEVDEVKDEEVEGEDKKKKKPVRGGGKRKRATKKGIEVKARVSKPQEEPEYFEDERKLLVDCSIAQLVPFKGANKILHVPAVVAVESPFPPSDKIGITSVQREVEEIIPMKTMEMDWLPYIPVDKSVLH
ncbi:PREDICTED: KNR4/SMI1 homolog 2-like [Brassica oleracea var. oleracea]|uniref:KNR4/SMI1 homolog 2-like n=1 Tax=Brassica oleracea var. oleracea TaxID=109376 RepID=UPI0006A735DB|nr:PREDICTED: KNR4/SMI1 homolog 2-like [Brassica oleracea var. oleracea]